MASIASHLSLDQLVLSTMWMQHRFQFLADFAAAGQRLGFGGIEVSHIVTPQMIGDALPASLGIKSVHFPAPTQPSPYGRPAEALLSSSDDNARTWAVAQGRASIDFAHSAGAGAVCLHLGEVQADRHLEWALAQRYLGGQGESPIYAEARQAVGQHRAAAANMSLAAARRSLEELAAYARPRNVRLGIESRVHHWQIPTFAELGQLLEDSDPQVVGFWYDSGHVQVLHNLGFHRHQDWLEAYGDRIVGVHFHDVIGLRDHLLPGLGKLDFGQAWMAVPPGTVVTCEFDWYYGEQEVVQGAEHLLSTHPRRLQPGST